MGCKNAQIITTNKSIKLIGTLVLYSCFVCEVAFGQQKIQQSQQGQQSQQSQQKELEQELMNIIQTGVDEKILSAGLRDTILQFIKSNNTLSPDKFLNTIKNKDGISIGVQEKKLPIDKTIGNPLNTGSGEVKNGINTSLMLPDKLPVPARDSKNRYQMLSQQELKQTLIRIDYFSNGIDGYYRKLIAMGYVGEGWVETKAAREAMERVKAEMVADLARLGLVSSTPDFITTLSKSRNPLKQILGQLLMMLQNGANAQVRSGYRNPNPMIRTATPGFAPVPSGK
ncbi:MAG: hypothetical protein RR555_05985 [Bacteroidales bacterium]